MKRFNLRSMAFLLVSVVLLASCTAVREGAVYEDAPVRKRVYTTNPYSGNVIVVERDPFTGQLYEVGPGGFYGSPYGNRFGYGYGNGFRNGYPYRGGGVYRPAPSVPSRPRTAPTRVPTPQRKGSETTNKARSIIRGDRN